MTDKVQKIRSFLVGIADTDGVSTILARAIEKKILPYIDSLQEEPVSDDFKLFEKEYLEKEKDEILCVYDRGLVDGAQWQKLYMIEKACKWLDENAAKYLIDKSVHGVKMTGLDTSFTEDFKKAMEA